MSQHTASASIIEIDRRLKYIDRRNEMMKGVFQTKPGHPQILPNLKK